MEELEIPLTKAEILTSLSRALDLVEGQPPGHAIRTLWIALKIAGEMGFTPEQSQSLAFAALIKDSGCSNNSVRIQKIFGADELISKRAVKTIDWTSKTANALYGLRYVEYQQDFLTKIRGLKRALGEGDGIMREVTEARCTRGALIASRLGFGIDVSDAVRDLDEHWDGKGAPRGLKGDETGLIARVLGCAQTLEVFATEFGAPSAYRMLRKRKGKWFDPEIVRACEAFGKDAEFWEGHALRVTSDALEIPPLTWIGGVAETEIDAICEAFAMIVDAKSGFTAEHSTRVTAYAIELGRAFGFTAERLRTLRRSALLHDVGKLGVSNGILEKNGKLTDAEFTSVRLHPRNTYDVLSPIRGFARIANLAGAHHERLDGRGYWRGWGAAELDLDMRILAVTDVFDALSADRPYGNAMPMEQVFAILDKESGSALDPDCIQALRERYAKGASLPKAA